MDYLVNFLCRSLNRVWLRHDYLSLFQQSILGNRFIAYAYILYACTNKYPKINIANRKLRNKCRTSCVGSALWYVPISRCNLSVLLIGLQISFLKFVFCVDSFVAHALVGVYIGRKCKDDRGGYGPVFYYKVEN